MGAHPTLHGAKLVNSNSQLDFILAATPDGVLTIDRMGRVASANAAAGRLLGHPAESLIGRPIGSFVAKSERVEEFTARLIREGEVQSAEMKFNRADGCCRWLSISARTRPAPSRLDANEFETFVFLRDVTERHAAREALERKNEELEAYVRGVSHDLRSPLVSLLGFSRLLRDDYQDTLPRTGLHFLDRIEQAGRNMERLLHDMLELSRIGETAQCRVPVNPGLILEQLASELKLPLDEKGITLQLPKDCPTLLFDRTRLYQILSNLIGNAVHHMNSDSGGLIRVDVGEVEDGWQISVRDNGPGIAPMHRERIFQAFQTAGRLTSATKSSGLGLAIVKKIVDAHAGRIWLESEFGLGSRFVVWLPRD
jgi:PAS domain S-box-containing protein